MAFLTNLVRPVRMVRGCYKLVRSDDEDLAEQTAEGWIERAQGNLAQAELWMNHAHLADIMYAWAGDYKYTVADVELMGWVYEAVLRHALACTFPDVEFEVISEGREKILEDPIAYWISFCRKRKEGDHQS